jgi:hypothetical protein
MLAKMSDALTEAQIPYVWIDGDAALARFDDVRLVVWPSYEFASKSHWERLTSLAGAGKKVIYGPSMPELDERMRLRHFETPQHGERVLLDTADDARTLVRELDETLRFARPFPVTPLPLETTVHEDGVGPRVLFVLNPDRPAKDATITLPEPMRLLDLRTGQRFEGDREVVIPIAGLTVRVFVIETDRDDEDAPRLKPRARRKGR